MNKPIIIILFFMIMYLIYDKALLNDFVSVFNKDAPCESCKVKEKYVNPMQFIDQVFTYLSKNDKVVLNGSCNKLSFITPNIPQNVNDEVDEMLKFVLTKINKLCCTYLSLRNKNLVLVEENQEGKRFIVDSILHDVNDHFSVRFVLDYVLIGDKRYINYISVANTSVYNLRNPPANSSTSINNLAKEKGEQLTPMTDSQHEMDWNVRLTELYHKQYNVVGVEDVKLENSSINFKSSGLFSMDDRNKWLIPFDQLGKTSGFCKKELSQWSRNGLTDVTYVGDGCVMLDTSYESQNVLPNDNPDKVGLITEYGDPSNSKNGWLFNTGEFGNVRVETALA